MYEKPLLYDIAFSYRDYRQEVDLLLAWAERAGGRKATSALELAAGPADHAIELASRGLEAAALDLSASMCEYARAKAARRGAAVAVHRGDMTNFSLQRRFDLAITMISSLCHVYTVDAMVRHLGAVARHFAPGGVYIVEMPHPADFLWKKSRCSNAWTQARDGVEVEVRWGRDDDPHDPIAQIHEATVALRVRNGNGGVEEYEDRIRMKEWTASEFDAAIRLSGAFDLAERHGDFALDAPFDNSPESWRMISVLRARG